MNKLMADYIIEELDARGFPYHVEATASGRTTFTLDDRMIAKEEVSRIFNYCFARSTNGWVEVKVTH